MSNQRSTPRTDANSWVETNPSNALTLASFSENLELELNDALEQARVYREQLEAFEGIDADRVKFKALAVELRDALTKTLASLIINMVPQDVDTVEGAHQVLGKAKKLLKL